MAALPGVTPMNVNNGKSRVVTDVEHLLQEINLQKFDYQDIVAEEKLAGLRSAWPLLEELAMAAQLAVSEGGNQ